MCRRTVTTPRITLLVRISSTERAPHLRTMALEQANLQRPKVVPHRPQIFVRVVLEPEALDV
jgi:hypothetical protein